MEIIGWVFAGLAIFWSLLMAGFFVVTTVLALRKSREDGKK